MPEQLGALSHLQVLHLRTPPKDLGCVELVWLGQLRQLQRHRLLADPMQTWGVAAVRAICSSKVRPLQLRGATPQVTFDN